MTNAGVCTNARCARAVRGESIDRYAGPGQFCPECGELLSPQITEPPPLTEPPPPAKPPPLLIKTRPRRRTMLVAGAVVALAVIAVLIARGTQLVSALSVRVCTSTMTDRIANLMVDAYSAHHRVWPYHYTVTEAGNSACDVRFYAEPAGTSTSLFARDGVVVVVNPQNTIARLEIGQIRDIFAGRIADWSQLGGSSGAIAAAVPDDNSDEAHVVTARVMGGQALGPHVIRTFTALQIARWVSSPSGVRSIGVLPFSVALPAKVLALGSAPAPSSLSIAGGRYPLSMGITVASDFRFPSRPAAALVAFANSGEANDLISRSALVTKNGL